MAFSDEEIRRMGALLEPWFERRNPLWNRDQVVLRHRITGHDLLIFEMRRHFLHPERWNECPVAKIRFRRKDGLWTLFSRDRNGRWHAYPRVGPTPDLEPLVDEVDRDPTGIFWG